MEKDFKVSVIVEEMEQYGIDLIDILRVLEDLGIVELEAFTDYVVRYAVRDSCGNFLFNHSQIDRYDIYDFLRDETANKENIKEALLSHNIFFEEEIEELFETIKEEQK